MDQEILPIGSICTLKNDDKKILIVGLYSVVYDKDIIVYDYQGCSYPEGLSLSDRIYSFNHDEIGEIIYKGYADDEFKKLRDRLMCDPDEYYMIDSDGNEKCKKFINNDLQPIEDVEEESDIEILVLD